MCSFEGIDELGAVDVKVFQYLKVQCGEEFGDGCFCEVASASWGFCRVNCGCMFVLLSIMVDVVLSKAVD